MVISTNHARDKVTSITASATTTTSTTTMQPNTDDDTSAETKYESFVSCVVSVVHLLFTLPERDDVNDDLSSHFFLDVHIFVVH